MRDFLRRFWVLLPILASTATDCDESPRGAVPTLITNVELVLEAVPEDLPSEDDPIFPNFQLCVTQMGQVQTHVRPSWRATTSEPGGQLVLMQETTPNRFVANFFDVPVDFLNVMTVHDINQCVRDPLSAGHVAMGVFVNGTEVTFLVSTNNALGFVLNEDGSVVPPPTPTPQPAS